MNIANKLTLLRMGMVPIFVLLRYLHLPFALPISGIVFIIASLTDMLDGHYARKHHLITNFGKFADPLADKILAASAMICLVDSGLIPAWSVIIIISREFAITGFRIIAASENINIAAGPLGKLKTITQLIGLSLLLFYPLISPGIGLFFYYFSVVMTVISGIDYIVRNKKVLDLENI
ncbi:MAG: CDP-diacylglycerol--glycerol-3-phosphate 3-phosphatidyltransferase [Tissierellia bacterium]|nr:CDP-diacylglycerol--glycerol-3-phosphate 3-phosphatidyltransferase [Tissierellia bacterium]